MLGGQNIELGERDLHVWVVPLDDPDKKRRRELAHLAQGTLLAAYLGVTPAMLEFERTTGGKPRLRGEPLQFNLSHSENLALIGVAREMPLGVDVQAPHPSVTRPWFAKRICSSREYEHFGGNPGPEDLLRLWTRKEAVFKARGEGSYVTIQDIEVLEDELDGWQCRDLELSGAPGYHAAVAMRTEAQPSVRVLYFAWP